jgi:hypothetical protein
VPAPSSVTSPEPQMDQRNVSQYSTNDAGKIDISYAATGVAHGRQPNVAGERCSSGW